MPLTRKVDLRNLNRVKRPATTTTNLDPITYNDRYPGLDEYNYNKLSSKIDSLGLSGYDREKAMDEAYIQVLPLVQNDIKNSDRRKYINQAKYDVSQIQDPTQQKQANMKLSTVELAQLVKEKYNVDPTANDEAVFNSWMETIPNGEQLLVKYLNSGDKELLYKGGLEKDPNEGKQKLRDNFWDSLWDNIKTKANIPVDNFKKRGKRTFNEASEKIYKNMLKNTLGDGILGKMGINLDNYVDTVTDKTLSPALQQDTLNYQNQINERYQALEQKNMDQDIKNYYDNKGYTKLLGEGDFKGFLYKSMGDAAQNREMPAVIAASVFQPEIGMALMTTDAYARENQEAFENMMNNGATYEQAEQGAVAVGLVNAAVEVTLEKLLGGVETSASSAIRKTLMKNVQEEAAKKGLGRILLEGVGTQLRASGEEGLEEIIQQIVQNAAVKTVNENQELFEGVGQAFEGGFYNPLNLLAGGGNINQNINQNKDVIREQIMEGAYNAGQTTRNITDKVGITKDGNTNTQGDVAVEGAEMVTEKTEKPGVIDRITDWGAEKITNTVSAQDKLYKAQEPRMNTLTRKKDLEKRREHSDRANQLIVQNGYIPTNTAERLEAHETTMKNIWKQVENGINGGQEIMVDLSQIADVLDEYIQSQRDTKSTLTEGDLAKLEKESQALRGQQVSLPVAERLKQLYNAVINNRGEEKASDTMANGLQKATHEIGVIEDSLLSEIPGEFQGLKNDFGALRDTYEDVFKADMKNQRKKGSGLTETYSRIEGIGDIANGLLGVATGKGDIASIGKGAAKFLVGKSLAKASDVDFLIEQGFKELAKQYGNNGNITTNTAPTTPTATAPTTRTTTEITEDIDVGANPTYLTEKETIQTPTEEVKVEETVTPKKETKKTTKPTTPKQETKTEDNSDLREKIGDRFYNYLKERADNVNRSRKTLAPVTIEELLTSGPYHDSTKFIDIYERDVRNKLDNIMYQIGKLDLPEVKLTKEQQNQLYEASALNGDRDMLRIKLMKEWIDKNPSKAGEKLTELTNEGADMVEQLEKAKAYVAEIEKAQENKEAKTKETIKPKKQTKKTTKKSEGLDKNQASSKTATPQFKKRFGDSKVVDSDGKPLVVYHGTENFGRTELKGPEIWDYDRDRPATDGIYFTDSKEEANGYESSQHSEIEGKNKGTYEVYLSMKNPLVVDFEGSWWNGKRYTYTVMDGDKDIRTFRSYEEAENFKKTYDKENNTKTNIEQTSVSNNGLKDTKYYVQQAKEEGYDGVIFLNIRDSGIDNVKAKPSTTYAVFNSNQIKSVNNNGKFSKSSNMFE